ncbi:hypothetical protein SHKM778_69790 [Streptomyces sp. KM77-8]|uniref:Uncharacterized protein n=1 Tax=Streptomyces haneummycinicus TaxID=3074435 RepID=A0AAT9HTD8_9ACTN
MTQLDIYVRPGDERDEEADPWPTYPKLYRSSAAHEEARELRMGAAADADGDGDVRVFAASTLRFSGDGEGRVRALHLVEVDAGRRAVAGTERMVPTDLVLLALGFSGPDPGDGLVAQLGVELEERGTVARDGGSGRMCEGCSPRGMPLGGSR